MIRHPRAEGRTRSFVAVMAPAVTETVTFHVTVRPSPLIQYVTALYRVLRGKAPTPAELAAILGRNAAGGTGLAS
jgi:hypothetical protein